MTEEKETIVHDACGLPVEFCECPDATMIHHDCEICDGTGEVEQLAPKHKFERCPKCDGEGEYFEIKEE